jgi:hypothetical protein
MTDLITVLGEAAAAVEPRGENEDLSVLCGLVAWAVEHPDAYHGWDAETLTTALRWNFDVDVEDANEIARRFAVIEE